MSNLLLLKCIVEESAGGLKGVLALARRLTLVPGEGSEEETAAVLAGEGISAPGALQECVVAQGGR